jgi:hypothetical protein
MMKNIPRNIDTAFRYCLLGLFLYTSVTLFFIFVLNWEARFFGMKLDGFPAGVLLGIRFLAPAILALILIRYPKKIMPVALMALAFFGFFFVDSSMTIQMNTGGKVLFGTIPLVSVLIPVVVLIGNFLVIRYKNSGKER